MNRLFVFILALVPFFCYSQTNTTPAPLPITSYTIEGKVDSFYLVQRIEETIPGNDRPKVSLNPLLIKGEKDWIKFLADLRKRATDQREQARKLIEGAVEIENQAAKIEAVGKSTLKI